MNKRLCPKCDREIIYRNNRCFKNALKENTVCKSCAVAASHKNNPERFIGPNNPMFGTSAIKQWKETLTEDEFINRREQLRLLNSKKSKGANNPMFGKPSPNGSGRGKSGVWRGIHFRSLLEFAFLVWFNTQFGYMPMSAERKEYSILLKSGKNYFPDFVDRENNIYEIKPSRMINLNLEKFMAAREKHGEKFKVFTEKELPNYFTIHKNLAHFSDLTMKK